MSVETATFISDLNPLDPVHTDGLNQADSHLRLIKSTLQTTFQNVTGAVTATHTDLNSVPATNAAVTLLGTNRVRNDIAQTMAGPLTVTAGFNAATIAKGGNELVPTGIICMWSGLTTNVPAGWHLCDGTNGTPNMIGLFIVGAGAGGPAPGQTGGQDIQTLATSTIGPHSHGGSTGAVGTHAHGAGTAGYVLQVTDLPSHNHGVSDPGHAHTTGSGGASVLAGPNVITLGGPSAVATGTATTGISVGFTGGGQAHAHGIIQDGGHAHTIAADDSHNHTFSIDVRPAYYAVCFVMKL